MKFSLKRIYKEDHMPTFNCMFCNVNLLTVFLYKEVKQSYNKSLMFPRLCQYLTINHDR